MLCRYEIIDYADVWGNPYDGFEVNQEYRTGTYVDLQEDASEEEIIQALIKANYLLEEAAVNKDLHTYSSNWEDIELTLDIVEGEEPAPVGVLEFIGFLDDGESEVAEDEL